MEAYCVKCRAKKEMKNPKAVTMKNKKPATTGTCPTCGTKMFKIGKSKQLLALFGIIKGWLIGASL